MSVTVGLPALRRGESAKELCGGGLVQRGAGIQEHGAYGLGEFGKAIHIIIRPGCRGTIRDQSEDGSDASSVILGLGEATQECEERGMRGDWFQAE